MKNRKEDYLLLIPPTCFFVALWYAELHIAMKWTVAGVLSAFMIFIVFFIMECREFNGGDNDK